MTSEEAMGSHEWQWDTENQYVYCVRCSLAGYSCLPDEYRDAIPCPKRVDSRLHDVTKHVEVYEISLAEMASQMLGVPAEDVTVDDKLLALRIWKTVNESKCQDNPEMYRAYRDLLSELVREKGVTDVED